MRLFYLSLLFVPLLVYSHNVHVDVWALPQDEDHVEELNRIIRLTNAENNYFDVNLRRKTCGDENLPPHCTDNGIYIKISDDLSPAIFSLSLLAKEEYSIIKQSFTRTLARFATKYYNSLSNSVREDVLWENLHHLEDGKTTSANIKQLIKESKEDYFFALFYAPVDFENLAALFYTKEALESTKVVGVYIDVTEDSNRHENTMDTPILRAYKNKKRYIDFTLNYNNQSVIDWIKTLHEPIVRNIDEREVPSYRKGRVPGFDKPVETLTIMMVPSTNDPAYKNYYRFAKENHGKFHLTAAVSEQVKKWKHHPAFITIKARDRHSNVFTMHEDMSYDAISNYLQKAQLTSLPSMTSASNLLLSLSQSRLLIFFDAHRERSSIEFEKLAANYTYRSNICSFTVASGLDLFSLFIATELSIDVNQATYILIDSQMHKIATKTIDRETGEEVLKWISGLQKDDFRALHLDSTILKEIEANDRRRQLAEDLQRKMDHKKIDHNTDHSEL